MSRSFSGSTEDFGDRIMTFWLWFVRSNSVLVLMRHYNAISDGANVLQQQYREEQPLPDKRIFQKYMPTSTRFFDKHPIISTEVSI